MGLVSTCLHKAKKLEVSESQSVCSSLSSDNTNVVTTNPKLVPASDPTNTNPNPSTVRTLTHALKYDAELQLSIKQHNSQSLASHTILQRLSTS